MTINYRAKRGHMKGLSDSQLNTVSNSVRLHARSISKGETIDSLNLLRPQTEPKLNGFSTRPDLPSSSPTHPPKPIAICGMALRLPGKITTPEQFWHFLLSKGDARSRIPESRYSISGHHSQSGKPSTIKTEHGYFLDTDLGALDASFFSMTKTELERIDPQQRQLLEVTRECFENAGETNWRGKNIGCFVGSFGEDWCELFSKDSQQHGLWRVTGYGDFTLSNRLSYEYDLRGPSMTIRTGCSASLVSLHEACLALERGDCSSALVGGANLIMSPGMTTAMTEQGVLSPDGSCKSFDAAADGYARGEAINAIFIKPLEDAIRDGNPIRAIIRSTATNCDGKTPGISQPSTEAHEAMIRRAYEVAGIKDVSKTGFVECHGTGTPIGDPIEANAVGNIFGERGVYIGSVKPNLGHSEGASGLTSLIKMVLALEHRTIPPNIKFTKPNPKIPFHSKGLKVPVDAAPWPRDRELRASINSFGIGGANAHVIIDSPLAHRRQSLTREASHSPHLLVFSANSQNSLKEDIHNHTEYLMQFPARARQLAYTLGLRREHLPHRSFCVVTENEITASSPPIRAGASPEIVMVFTGQGAQWPGMGREMLQSNPVFRTRIAHLQQVLDRLPTPERPKWRLEEELMKPAKISQLHRSEFAQPLCTAIQVALIDCFAAAGIKPGSVVGHSSGEIAAAYAAEAITASEAIIIAYYRGLFTRKSPRAGGMAAVGLGWEETSTYLKPGVVIACENSPNSVTISGDESELELVLLAINKNRPDIMARRLKVEMAYHSSHMKAFGGSYNGCLDDKVFSRNPVRPFYSSVTGTLLAGKSGLGPSYWRLNLESPVLFRTAIESILRGPGQNKIFLEVGPHSALAGPLRQTMSQLGVTHSYVPALLRDKDCVESFLSSLGQLWQHGLPVDFKALTPTGSVLTDLPPYPWNHDTSYWYESRLSKAWRYQKFSHHDLLGSLVTESTDFEPSWRNVFHLDNAPWIRDHKIRDDIVFPCAGYIGMIGEAVRQVTGVEECYKLRHVVVSTALVLVEGRPTEIITSLRQHRLTDSLDSQWWEFSIASHNGTSWTKHCTGEARAQGYTEQASFITTPLPRGVESARWYDTMRRVGLNYGPSFQGLGSISSATMEQRAAGRCQSRIEQDMTEYPIHPTAIDFLLQLLSVAVAKGIPRSFAKMAVPTNIEEVEVYQVESELDMTAVANSTPKGAICGDCECHADGKLALRMRGVKLSPLEDEEQLEVKDNAAAARLEWRPDLDFLDPGQLIKPASDREVYGPMLDQLTRLCIIEARQRLLRLSTDQTHLQKYRVWLEGQMRLARKISHHKLRDFVSKATSSSSSNRVMIIQDLAHKLSLTEAKDAVAPMLKILENCSSIFEGTLEPLEVLMADETLTKLYNFMDQCNRTDFIQHLAHSKPSLRVLEIGAGTGGTTASILNDLKTANGQPTYSKYTFTDISSGFFVAAKERFKNHPNMEFAALDISKDPVTQGFDPESYDLVLATNVLHATPCLQETLRNVRKLLSPDGRLLVQELCEETKWTNFIMGVLPGWWLGEADGRMAEPYVSPERWRAEFMLAGFDGLEAVVIDAEEPYQLNAVMIARPMTIRSPDKRVALLCGADSKLLPAIEDALLERGYDVALVSLQDSPPPGQDVIAILDIDKPFFENISAQRFELFQTFVNKLDGSGLLWLTRSSQMHCDDPSFAQTIGAARAIRSELSIEFATCEVDEIDSCVDTVMSVFRKFQVRQSDHSIGPDYEYAISKGVINVGRYQPCSLQEQAVTSKSGDAVALQIGKHGRLSTLQWVEQQSLTLAADEVEIETRAVGMNFRDVLVAMGIVDESDTNGFGLEASGIVRKVGADVTDLVPGDRVVALGKGCFSTTFKTSAQLCAKMMEGLSFEDGATMPCVYGTVIWSLMDVGQLRKGQSILIHSACGGVGIAAIQIAREIGAEIFVTVGNDEKVQYLMSTFGIPRNRIFNSRDSSFLPETMRETNGIGVDIVLNSLSGELLHASWQCVAEFGKLVEIGKRDLIGFGKLDMNPFMANRSYCGVDLDQICIKKPGLCNRLLGQMMKSYAVGHIQPIRPITTFEAASIEDCFRYMQKGQHIGKIVVSMSNAADSVVMKGTQRSMKLDPEASYLLVGGLGGLGRTVSTWMIEQGARSLVYLSRSAGTTEEDKMFFHELESQDCKIKAVAGTVSSLKDVKRAVSSTQKPLKGVLQMSMILRDQALPAMTFEEWTTVVDPKVQGTWNLHQATKGLGLDFFVLFSSISGVIGQPGQTNYAAANTFLDAFVQYRHSLRLPASSIDIGLMEDSGYVARNGALLNRLKATGAYTLREPDLLAALQVAMRPSVTTSSDLGFTSQSQTVIGLHSSIPLDDENNRSIWKKDRRMALYHNESGTTASKTDAENDELKTFLQTASTNPEILKEESSTVFLATQIGKKLFSFLLRSEDDLDISQSLAAVGMDSLMAIEMKSWWRQAFGLDISVLEMLGMGSIRQLGGHCSEGLVRKLAEG